MHYGCLEGRCSVAAEGESGSPAVLFTDELELVVGIHQSGCSDWSDKCTLACPGISMDIRKFCAWMDENMKEREAEFA